MNERTVRRQMERMNDKQAIKLTNDRRTNMTDRTFNVNGEWFLTESGLYKLIFKSRAPKAEEFSDWVADEVLPSIRKTGKYYVNDEGNLTREFLDNLSTFFSSIKLMIYQSRRFACILLCNLSLNFPISIVNSVLNS
jgi:prophage antirepressor-like protein